LKSKKSGWGGCIWGDKKNFNRSRERGGREIHREENLSEQALSRKKKGKEKGEQAQGGAGETGGKGMGDSKSKEGKQRKTSMATIRGKTQNQANH